MRRIVVTWVVVLCIARSAQSAQADHKWWRRLPPGEAIAELPMGVERAGAEWDVSPGMRVVTDEILARPAIEHSGRAAGSCRTRRSVRGPFEAIALVRITEEKASRHGVTLACGMADGGWRTPAYSLAAASFPGSGRFRLRLTPTLGSGASRVYQTTRPAAGGRVKTPWPGPLTVAERFSKIPPNVAPALRREIEAAMAGIPPAHRAWFRLRIERRHDAVRLYKDGLLVAERKPAGRAGGVVGLRLQGNVRVASFVVRRLGDGAEGFVPVRLDDACNARVAGGAGTVAIRSGSLPPAGARVAIQDIPFVFPTRTNGLDHIDVGLSLFRYRNQAGFFNARTTWPAPGALDPARILLRVPNRPYRRLWVVAASDGGRHSVPTVTARFYRPHAGFAIDAAAQIPPLTATSGPKGTRRLPVTLADGRPGSLWLVPIELDAAAIGSRFRHAMALSVELTKEVHDHRAYPDPALYDTFQGGLPSGVRIFALTLEEAPLRLIASGNRAGNAYVSPEEPVWNVRLRNLRNRDLAVRTRVTVTGPYGKTATQESRGVLGPRMAGGFELPLATSVFGLHRVETTVEAAGETFSREGTFVQLPPDTRRATAANSRWGLWWWRGGHLTNPNEEEDLYLLRAAGTRVASARELSTRRAWGMFPSTRIVVRGPAEWAYKDPHDPKDYAAFSEEIGRKVAATMAESPDAQYFAIFAENAISRDLTYGILPRYVGEPEYVLDDKEKARVRASTLTAKAASEGIRRHAPKAKIAFGWCEPTFSVPFMRAKYPKDLMDAVGVDVPQFERMPEMPIRSVAPNRLWILQEERKRLGYTDVPIIHTESYFPSSHRLALGPRRAADHYVRTAVLSLALGSQRLLFCFTLHDCADYWGTTHYGCIGVTGPWPEFDPKPAFPAYATMTRLLDLAQFDGHVPTGSLTAYCVRFKSGRTFVYCLWTVRGSRTARLLAPQAARLARIDEHGNEAALKRTENAAAVMLTPTPVWVTADRPIEKVELGTPSHPERPGEHTRLLDPLDRLWSYEAGPYERYATNHWDLPRFPGPMKQSIVEAAARRSKVWQVVLAAPPKERKLAAWYGVFRPPSPIPIPGKARAIGVWANGRSNWGRIIYEVHDAKGEIWQSIGAKDQWNCDDVHSWSYFNFDGWRYLEFPLPGHLPGDDFRERDTVWWNHSEEGIVDLPVRLTRIIIEHRTHHIYVNQCVPVPDRTVQLDHLLAVYADAESMTEAPIRLQRVAAGVLDSPSTKGAPLPGPPPGR